MRIVVTGSSGFVGRHLCRRLQRQGHSVTGFDRQPSAPGSGFTFAEGDLGTGRGLDRIDWSATDAVFHLGAAGVKAGARDWPSCVRVNIMGTLNLLRCLECPASPTLVYVRTFYEDFIDVAPALAENPYVVTKQAATRLVREFAGRHPGGVVVARLFQVYGPGDASGNLIPHAVRQLRAGVPVAMGSGTGVRDWLHVSDVAAGLEACLVAGAAGRGCEFDVGSGELHPIRDVVGRLADIMGRPRSLLCFDPALDRGDTHIACKAERPPPEWRPRLALADGLADTAAADQPEDFQ